MIKCDAAQPANWIKAVGLLQARSPEDWNEKEKNLNAASGPSSFILEIRVPVASSTRKQNGASSDRDERKGSNKTERRAVV